jgi:hypothetical protein
VIGCILNAVQSHHHSYYYSRYDSYGYYDSPEQEKKSKRKKHRGKRKGEFEKGLEKIDALKEPFLALLSAGIANLINLSKGFRGPGKKNSSQ